MPELVLQHTADTLEVTFGQHHATVPWTAVAPDALIGQRIYDDAVAYGKSLFEQAFPDASLRTALSSLRPNERLLLVIDDPLVATLPWEYLRDSQGRLLPVSPCCDAYQKHIIMNHSTSRVLCTLSLFRSHPSMSRVFWTRKASGSVS